MSRRIAGILLGALVLAGAGAPVVAQEADIDFRWPMNGRGGPEDPENPGGPGIPGNPGTPGAACSLPWGGSIPSGNGIAAFLAGTVPAGETCQSEQRSCSNGVLSGGYQFSGCVVDAGGGGGDYEEYVNDPLETTEQSTDLAFSYTGHSPSMSMSLWNGSDYDWPSMDPTPNRLRVTGGQGPYSVSLQLDAGSVYLDGSTGVCNAAWRAWGGVPEYYPDGGETMFFTATVTATDRTGATISNSFNYSVGNAKPIVIRPGSSQTFMLPETCPDQGDGEIEPQPNVIDALAVTVQEIEDEPFRQDSVPFSTQNIGAKTIIESGEIFYQCFRVNGGQLYFGGYGNAVGSIPAWVEGWDIVPQSQLFSSAPTSNPNFDIWADPIIGEGGSSLPVRTERNWCVRINPVDGDYAGGRGAFTVYMGIDNDADTDTFTPDDAWNDDSWMDYMNGSTGTTTRFQPF